MDSRVRERLREFRVALGRYEHLSGLRVQRPQVVKAEEAQLTVIEMVREAAREAVARGEGLDSLVERLRDEGLLDRVVEEVASRLGYDSYASIEEAVEAVAGGVAGDRERPVFLALQAVARAYAEEYEAMHGVVESEGAACPVCGGVSDIAVLDGGYYMVCPFCFYKWRLGSEVYCPYCGNRDRLSIGLFMDRQRRVALAHCQACGSSWRLVMDKSIARRAPRTVLPIVALAAEKYRRLTPSNSGSWGG